MPGTSSPDHHLLLYRDAEDLLDQIGTAYGESEGLVVAACRPRHNAEIRMLVGRRRVVDRDRFDIHTRPAATLTAYRRLAELLGDRAGHVTVLAEHDAGSGPADWVRAARWEAAANLTAAPHRTTSVCAYPSSAPAPLLAHLARTHPVRLTAAGQEDNAEYTEPMVRLRELATATPVPAPASRPALHLAESTSIQDIGRVRKQVDALLTDVPTLIRTDFVAAVNEVLTNAYVHGEPPLELAMWVEPGHLECRVTDHGPGRPDPVAGYEPTHPRDRAGAGLWLARQACDDIDMWRDGGTFTVRVATAVTGAGNSQTSGAIARAETARVRTALLAQRRVIAPVRLPEEKTGRRPEG
jgi:anti-sigma regulatory factor (Ser/Thr protein kinase)